MEDKKKCLADLEKHPSLVPLEVSVLRGEKTKIGIKERGEEHAGHMLRPRLM